jgi:hypothetical protein|nr:MAG TPA: hypothetical protein [Caudoviricetes sp.]DAR41169.1 MAG TPA: hypothetical protein [Caudoviricetes sp.]
MRNVKVAKSDNIDIITTFVFVVIFALICGYYALTSNAASLKTDPNDDQVANAIRTSLILLDEKK